MMPVATSKASSRERLGTTLLPAELAWVNVPPSRIVDPLARPAPSSSQPLAAAIGLAAIATVVLGFAPQMVIRLGELAWLG